jgi:hypothetical protein
MAASEKPMAGRKMTPENLVFIKERDQDKASLPFNSNKD